MMRALLCSAVVFCAAAAAAAEDRKCPGEYPTIQAAVDAAAEGDVVVVGPGVYAESVVAAKSNITIQGRDVTWDGGVDGSAGTCLALQGDGNAVAGLTFTGGTDQVTLTGNGNLVTHCVSVDASGSFVVAAGNDNTVVGCKVSGAGGSAVEVTGDACLVKRIRALDCDGTAIEVSGDANVVARCTIRDCADGGVSMDGTDCTCTGNHVFATAAFGFDLTVDSSLIARNLAIHCGSEGGAGFEITGDEDAIRANVAVGCTDDGFRIEGNADVMRHDTATGCDDDGFDIQGGAGITITGSTSANNDGSGMENGGTGTDATDNQFVANETDVSLDGNLLASFDGFSGNVYTTGSITTVVTGD
jgi:hypothetical protein